MSRKPRSFTVSLVLSSLLLAILFIPGAQTALDVVFSPLRKLTYPKSTSSILYKSTKKPNTDLLQVISYGVNPAQRQIIVDISSKPVEVGDAVLAEGVLVGVVDEISKDRAEVTLINDPSFRVISRTDTDARGLVISSYDQLQLIDVALDQRLRVGDTVRTLNNQYPNVGQAVIGVVDEIIDNNGLLKGALLSQPLQLDNLTHVSIP